MKKILSLFTLVFALSCGFAQTFQATIQPLPSSGAGVTVFVKTPAAVTGKVSSLTITLAIPVSVGPRPPITVNNAANPYIGYDVYTAINQTLNGTPHYIYNILGTGDVVPAAATRTFAAGADVPMLTINFNGNPAISSQIKMANLPDGGTDPNPNSYFGFSIDGIDIVNLSAMFYGIPTVSTATNDGLGYSGTSFAQTVALVPLPVKFLSFNAFKKDNTAQLDWSVQNESAVTDRYEIERSFNGRDFTMIATVAARNNGLGSNGYGAADQNLSALRNSGKIYYRVKQIDKDNRFVYTEIRSVRLDGKTFDAGVYPNPVVSTASVNIDLDEAGTINLLLLDAAGQKVKTIAINGTKGLNVYSLNMNKFSAGTYVLKVQNANQSKSITLVKK